MERRFPNPPARRLSLVGGSNPAPKNVGTTATSLADEEFPWMGNALAHALTSLCPYWVSVDWKGT
jgi:hypothetical protein